MPGGGTQGTLLGVLEYNLVQWNKNADCVDENLRFKYIDKFTFLELISLSTLSHGLSSCNVKNHVPCDIGVDQPLYTDLHKLYISQRSDKNLMLINADNLSNWRL